MAYKKGENLRTKIQRGNEYPTYDKKATSIGHVVRRNCLLKHVIEGKMEEVERRGR